MIRIKGLTIIISYFLSVLKKEKTMLNCKIKLENEIYH